MRLGLRLRRLRVRRLGVRRRLLPRRTRSAVRAFSPSVRCPSSSPATPPMADPLSPSKRFNEVRARRERAKLGDANAPAGFFAMFTGQIESAEVRRRPGARDWRSVCCAGHSVLAYMVPRVASRSHNHSPPPHALTVPLNETTSTAVYAAVPRARQPLLPISLRARP